MSAAASLQSASGNAKSSSQATRRGLLLQRQCGCGSPTASLSGECAQCGKKKLLQAKLALGASHDPLEQEADRVAEQVLAAPSHGSVRAAPVHIQRFSGRAGDETEAVPANVDQVLSGAGSAMEPTLLRDMENRFGHDFSRVRVHSDQAAEQSARDVNANAYTVGHHIVFGTNRFAPRSIEGRRLIAHELTHVVQQSGGGNRGVSPRTTPMGVGSAGRILQRACLSAAICAPKRATLTTFVDDTVNKPVNISKAQKREKACKKVPPDPKCTSDGHGARATALEALLTANYKSRLGFVQGVFVNKDIPADWDAVTQPCSSFMPPLPGASCTFVPDTLEAQAKRFQGGAKTVGGKPRDAWLTDALATLTHETEHGRFDAAPAIAEPSATACKFADLASNLTEMSAALSEMHVYYRDALTKTGPTRFNQFKSKFAFWVMNGSEDISDIVKEMRCKCECADADHYITKTAEGVASTQKWDTNEAFMIHTELSDPKWALKWPIKPGVVAAADLPSAKATPFKLE